MTILDPPNWVHWLILGGSWAVSLLQPLALLITVVYGGLQIYVLVRKEMRK